MLGALFGGGRFRNAMGRKSGGGRLECGANVPNVRTDEGVAKFAPQTGIRRVQVREHVDRAVARRHEDSIVAAKQTQSYFASSNVREGSKADVVAA